MAQLLCWIGVVLAFVGLIWLLVRLISKAQAGDRSCTGSDYPDYPIHSDTGPGGP